MSPKTAHDNPFPDDLYNRQLSSAEQASLASMPLEDLRKEIGVLRVFIARLLRLLACQEDVEAVAKIAQSLARIYTALNTTLRTQALLSGSSSAFEQALADALRDEPFYISTPGNPEPAPGRAQELDEACLLWQKIFDVQEEHPYRPDRRNGRRLRPTR